LGPESIRHIMVKMLDISQNSEALKVLKEAFASHPMFPPGTPQATTEAFLELIIDSFGHAEEAWLYGIRREGILACVSFSLDPRSEPKGIAIGSFFLRLFRILGWRLTKDFVIAFAKRPKYDDPYLDLMLLGTLPANHGQGLGRTMLRFLYGFAEEHGYHGIILDVAKDSPAYRFYLKEGLIVDSITSVRGMPLCYMRWGKGSTMPPNPDCTFPRD